MLVNLRPFQEKMRRDIYNAWDNGAINVMPVAATGSGKTVLLSKIILDQNVPTIAIAHRQELISQISTALARNGIRHKISGSNSTLLRSISAIHMFELGNSYYDPNSKVAVGGVDTLLRKGDVDKNIELMVQDEAHHCLRDNKWGKVAAYYPNAKGLLLTATPMRADGKGLGRHADGIVDELILAPIMRDIINMGYLTDYRIYAPPNNLDRAAIPISTSTGDFNIDATRKAVHKASITGDIVEHYLRLTPGKMGVTFNVDVDAATETAAAFRAAGVPAEVVSAKTPDYLRAQILRRHANRELLQLCNVDLFGEGFDLPALEVVSFARPTQSYGLYSQQFGRVLRLLIADEYKSIYDQLTDNERLALIAASKKPYGVIIDHVGNVNAHCLPDKYREWSLDRRDSRSSSKSGAIPIRICFGCYLAYEKIYKCCPYCAQPAPTPQGNSAPEYVDGDLTELSPDYLSKLRGEIEAPIKIPYGAAAEIVGSIRKKHFERNEIRENLKSAIAWWAGLQNIQGYTESQSYRLFYFKFGIDVASCQALSGKEMNGLTIRIENELIKAGVNYENIQK